ncbi:MAG: hypothetical protein JNK82_34660 [Myxococcaceae bacterium]|nr:hypothetical protein [Myxococcaceae bacterium]
MGIRIGTIFTGTVDRVGEQSVQTKFFMIGVPLVPLESYFVLQEQVNGVSGFVVPLHGKSVGLAYARWGSFIGAVIAGIHAMVTTRSWNRSAADFVPLAVCLVAWAITTFFLGSLGKREKARRSVLRSVTGLAALPSMLPAHVAEEVLKKLEAQSAGTADPALEFATALYRAHLLHDPAATERAEAAWARLESSASVVWA